MSRQAFIRELDLRWYRLPAVEKAVYAERERVEGKDKVLEEVQAMLREIQGDPMEQQGDSASGRNVPHARMMISGEHKYQCGLCGKGFKTEGGHKYHTTNVCIVNSMTVNH